MDPNAVFNDRIANQALIIIEDLVLNATNRPLAQFGLPTPDREVAIGNRLIVRETSYDEEEMAEIVDTREASLTTEQAQVAERVFDSVQNNKGGFFFVDAPGSFPSHLSHFRKSDLSLTFLLYPLF